MCHRRHCNPRATFSSGTQCNQERLVEAALRLCYTTFRLSQLQTRHAFWSCESFPCVTGCVTGRKGRVKGTGATAIPLVHVLYYLIFAVLVTKNMAAVVMTVPGKLLVVGRAMRMVAAAAAVDWVPLMMIFVCFVAFAQAILIAVPLGLQIPAFEAAAPVMLISVVLPSGSPASTASQALVDLISGAVVCVSKICGVRAAPGGAGQIRRKDRAWRKSGRRSRAFLW